MYTYIQLSYYATQHFGDPILLASRCPCIHIYIYVYKYITYIYVYAYILHYTYTYIFIYLYPYMSNSHTYAPNLLAPSALSNICCQTADDFSWSCTWQAALYCSGLYTTCVQKCPKADCRKVSTRAAGPSMHKDLRGYSTTLAIRKNFSQAKRAPS